MNAENMMIDGYLSVGELRVGNIECVGMNKTITSNMNVHSNTEYSNPDAFEYETVWQSLQACIDAIPSNLNGYTITININNDIKEDIEIRGFSGGIIIWQL